MKKSLIALAVFGAFSGAALADGSNVQLYGLLDEGFQHFDNGTHGSSQLSSGEALTSRFGMKGSEDLGSGLTASFQLEEGLGAVNDLQAGSGTQPRVADVALSGSFGTVAAGRMATFNHNDIAATDPFGIGMTGNVNQIGGKGLVSALDPVARTTALAYVSPNFSGVTLGAAWTTAGNATGFNTTGQATTGAWTLHGGYANGPITANVDYIVVNSGTVSLGNTTKASKDYLLTGTYDFGVAKLAAAYGDNKPDAGNGDEHSAWMLGVTVPVGPGNILASYAVGKDKVTSGQGKQFAVGYQYNLSKRTSLYTSYAHISNDGTYGAYVTGQTGADSLAAPGYGQSSSGFDLGMIVKF